MQCTVCHNFLHKKNSHLLALQKNREIGARYLDPKYSRWISVDPALGEYVPGTGKANAKDAGGLPGMGGIYNHINGNLYHYGGNNPVKYSDPDGRIIQVEGDDKQIYIWDNERNDFYNKKTKAYETSDNYVNEIKKAMVYLKESDFAADVIKSLTEITGITEIKRSYANTYEAFNNRTNIKFSVSGGLKLNDKSNSIHSPALGLFHEFSHSFSNLIEKKIKTRQKDTSVGLEWKNAEEKNAVLMTNVVAYQLHEAIRPNYLDARQFGMPSVTSFINNQASIRR